MPTDMPPMTRRAPESMIQHPGSHAPHRVSLAERLSRAVPTVPDHEILRRIGYGAYGEVWLARSVMGTYRAVKVVWRDDFIDDESFEREFRGILHYEPVARMNPNLVHILHVGRHLVPQPMYYYVMELADDAYSGIQVDPNTYVPRTLYSDMQHYGNRPMPLDYVVEVGCQLSRALQYLHAQDLTHRDVKPANVVFVNGRAKLADAGLVAQGPQAAFVGTQGYIPPEGPGSSRGDVYALGKVLYEMSTGKDREDFPELPDDLPEGVSRRLWLNFNDLVCRAAAPRPGGDAFASARHFAEQLELLRSQTLSPDGEKMGLVKRFCRYFKKHAVSFLLGAALLTVVLSRYFDEDGALAFTESQPALSLGTKSNTMPPSQQEASSVTDFGQLYVVSAPSGASIYTEDGTYLDETPYGPVSMKAGSELMLTLRKEGYADLEENGMIQAGEVLTLGSEMQPYRPPIAGEKWTDVLGAVYEPDGLAHRANQPVSLEDFKRFIDEFKPQGSLLYAGTNAADGSDLVLLYTNPAGISAYVLWLARQCERAGTLGREHSLVAQVEEGYPELRDELRVYRLEISMVQRTPISIYSNPAGASVFLNGRLLGHTPMQDVRVPLAPYYLEVRLPGYSLVRRTGLSPKDLVLNLELESNNSVQFQAPWINSLGQKMIPFGTNIMGGCTEVRVADMELFCRETGRMTPPKPSFSQNGHHPVVNVSRLDAEEFAAWLTYREREKGLIEATDTYRLPTDEEWSRMVGLRSEIGETPFDRQMSSNALNAHEFPWGVQWPPHFGAGNFADRSALSYMAANRLIPGYRDDFPYTAPVGSYGPNAGGFREMPGNVQEWVSGIYGGPEEFSFRNYGVLRGGSYLSFRPSQLMSGARMPMPIESRSESVGFRLILERVPKSQ